MKQQGHLAKVAQPAPDLLRMTNGLVTRDFLLQVSTSRRLDLKFDLVGSGRKFLVNLLCLQPAFATWDLHSSEADSSILRAFSPEARLVVKIPGGEVQHCINTFLPTKIFQRQ